MSKRKQLEQFASEVGRAVPYDQLPEFLTPEETCGYLGLSRNTVYELLRRNEMPHVRFGRSIRIPKTVLKQPHGDAVMT